MKEDVCREVAKVCARGARLGPVRFSFLLLLFVFLFQGALLLTG